MELIEHRCKRCGGELKNISEGRWSCPYCSCVYDEAVVQKNTKSLHEEFDEVKREIVCNLRRNLYDAVNEEYISSEKVRECATELKKYLPVDFAACFYEVAVGNNVKQLTKYIRRINVEENYSEIECVIRFLIKSLQTEYLLELNNLVERAYKQRDLVLFEKYSTEISLEAEKVEDGVYETKMPRDVFIAYSSKDMETVSELCEVLEGQGLKCFVAARNLRHGKGSVENYDRLLCEAMDHSKSFVFVSSTNSRSFSCDALIKELPYIQERDIENAPAEHKNNYASMPHSYKKPRVEYRIEESRGFSAPDAISNEFFDGYERVYSPEAVAERVAKQLLSAAEKKAVKKPTPAPAPAPVIVQSAPAEVGGQRIEPLLKRAAIFIDDGEWEDAEAYCEKALDIDPECAQAYIYKLMIDLQVKVQDELANCKESFEENGNFKKAVRFADEDTAAVLKGYSNAIKERNETERKEKIYNFACSLMREDTVDTYNVAISKFGEITNWKDSQKKIEECRKGIKQIKETNEINRKNEIYQRAISCMRTNKIAAYESAILEFGKIPGWKDANEQIEKCREGMKAINEQAEKDRKNDIYKQALDLMTKNDSRSLKIAIEKFKRIPCWKDADEKILECNKKLEEIDHQMEIAKSFAEKRKKKAIKISVICISVIAFVLIISILLTNVIIPAIEENQSYKDAINLMNDGRYEEAVDIFDALDGYKDSADRIQECHTAIKDNAYDAALKLIEEGKYDEAIVVFEAMDGYRDSADKIAECETALKDIDYNAAVALMTKGKYIEAIVAFEALGDHKDSAAKIEECKTALKDIDYNAAVALMTEGKYVEAIVAFEALEGYKDSTTKIDECNYAIKEIENIEAYNSAISLMGEGKYAEAIVMFEKLGDYEDSADKIVECETALKDIDYDAAVALMADGKYAEAIALFESLNEYNDSVNLSEKCQHFTEYQYCLLDDGYSISCYNGNDANLIIPNIYNGKVIVGIDASAFENYSGLISVTIPNSVTSIGSLAFYGCTSLTSIEMPDSVTSIGGSAFSGCTSLTTIEIPDSVTSIGSLAFYGCTSLITVTIPNSVTNMGARVFYECNSLSYNMYDNAYYLGNNMNPYVMLIKARDVGITSCAINDATKFIHGSAFENCLYLKDIVVPNSVVSVDTAAFRNCSSLNRVTLSNSLESTGDCTFQDCISLESINIPYGITSVGLSSFEGCTKLKNITLPDSITSIGLDAFWMCSSLQYNIYDNAYYLGNESNPYFALIDTKSYTSFSSCSIHDKTKIIAEYAFSHTDILYANIPDSVEYMGDGVFLNCTNLVGVSIGKGISHIGYSTFNGCTSLTSITIPGNITSIGWHAFDKCTKLTSVTFENKTGWRCELSTAFGGGCVQISSSDISDPSIAAAYLKEKYYVYNWCCE